MTPGQIAYIEDCRRKPDYVRKDGTRQTRRTWDQIGEPERRTWELNPTPRGALQERTIQ